MKLAVLPKSCSDCNLRGLCMPVGLTPKDMLRIDDLVTMRRPVAKGDLLFRAADIFDALFVVRAGFFKTTVQNAGGSERVTGFHMSGEMLGLDGIAVGAHASAAEALEDSVVCVIPFVDLEEAARGLASLQHHVHQALSKEIVHEHEVMLLWGSSHAETKLASFLINLLHRLHTRGLSDTDHVLRMTRQDIASYLGLTLETVSRLFAKMVAAGILEVEHRHLRILQPLALHKLSCG